MISGAGNPQLPQVFGSLLAVQGAAAAQAAAVAERIVAGISLPAIPASAAAQVVPAGAGANGVSGFSGIVLDQLASLLARSGGLEVQATAPPWVQPGAAPPTAPPSALPNGGPLADGAQSPGQPEMDLIGRSTGVARVQAASLPSVQDHLARLESALTAVREGGMTANPATPLLRRAVLRVAAADVAAGTEGVAGTPQPDPATDPRFEALVRRVRTMPVPELVAMAQAVLQQGVVPLPAEPAPAPVSVPALDTGSRQPAPVAPGLPVRPEPAAPAGLPAEAGIRQVRVAASADPAGVAPADSAGASAPAVSPAPARPSAPVAAATSQPALRAAAGPNDGRPAAAPVSADQVPNGLPRPASGGVTFGSVVTVEAVAVGGAIGAGAPTALATVFAPSAGLPQWLPEPARFLEAGFAAPVPAVTGAGAPASTGVPAPFGSSPAADDSIVSAVVVRSNPTDTGHPQETAPADPGLVGGFMSPGSARAAEGPQPSAQPAPGNTAGQSPENAVSSGSSPAAMVTATAVAVTDIVANVAEPANAAGPANQPVVPADPGSSAGHAGGAPAAPETPGAVVQPGQVSGNSMGRVPEVAISSGSTPATMVSVSASVVTGVVADTADPAGAAGPIGQPAAPETPGAVAQPGQVFENATSGKEAGTGGAPEARRQAGDDPLQAALARTQGALVGEGGISRPAAGTGVAVPAMGGEALQTALAQLVEGIAQTPPGGIRNIELRLNSEELGRVRVRLKLLDTGAVAIEFTASTARAAQVLRNDLPQLAQALEGRGTMLDNPQVLVAPVSQFAGNGSSDRSRQMPRWFEHSSRRGAGRPDMPEGLAAVAAYGRRWQIVDLLA